LTRAVKVLEVLGNSAGGIARHVAQVVSGLEHRLDLLVEVAAPPGLPIALPRHVHPVVIPDGPLLGHRRAISELRRIIREGAFDVVHAHGLRAGIDAAVAARGSDARVILTVHNLVQPDVAGRLRANLYRWGELLAVRGADRIFAVSRDIAEHLERSAAELSSKVEVLYLGVDDPPPARRTRAEVRDSLGLDEAQALIVTASRLSPQKAVHVMIEAVRDLDRVRLVVLGEGPLEAELRAAASGAPVTFLGFRDDVHDYIRAADAFCLSSVWEGIPLAVQEAILLGVPVVATDVGGMREVVKDGVSGRLVPKNDARALRDALVEVISDGALAERYAREAAAHLGANFSRRAMLVRLENEYRGAPRAA